MRDLKKEMSSLQTKLNNADNRQLVAVEQERAKLDCATRQLDFERHTNQELKDVRLSFFMKVTFISILSLNQITSQGGT